MQVQKERINVGQTIAGNPIDLVVYKLSAAAKGKKLYIQGGIHGGEITYWVLHRLFNFLRENLACGEVVLVPFANPASWEQKSYFYTFGKFDLYDGKDFNCNFPGSPDGTLHQRICQELFKLAKGSDLALDLHTARNSLPYCIYTKTDYAPFVADIGFKYNYRDTTVGPAVQGSFDYVLDPVGTPNICIECGSHDEYDAAKNDMVFEGLLRALVRLGMIAPSHAKPAEKSFYFEDHKKILAPASGFVRYDVLLGSPFKKGDALLTLHLTSDLGSQDVVSAPEDGVMYKHAPTHIYRVGDEMLHYIPKDWLKPL